MNPSCDVKPFYAKVIHRSFHLLHDGIVESSTIIEDVFEGVIEGTIDGVLDGVLDVSAFFLES